MDHLAGRGSSYNNDKKSPCSSLALLAACGGSCKACRARASRAGPALVPAHMDPPAVLLRADKALPARRWLFRPGPHLVVLPHLLSQARPSEPWSAKACSVHRGIFFTVNVGKEAGWNCTQVTYVLWNIWHSSQKCLRGKRWTMFLYTISLGRFLIFLPEMLSFEEGRSHRRLGWVGSALPAPFWKKIISIDYI